MKRVEDKNEKEEKPRDEQVRGGAGRMEMSAEEETAI